MIYKSLSPGLIAHTAIPIKKNLVLDKGRDLKHYYYHVLTILKESPDWRLEPILSFISANYIPVSHNYLDTPIKIFGREETVPHLVFYISGDNTLKIHTNTITNITFFKLLTPLKNYLLLLLVLEYGVEDNVIYSLLVVKGYYIKELACILWIEDPEEPRYIVSYLFNIDLFKYLTTIHPNLFNMTRNPSAYTKVDGEDYSILSLSFSTPYITSIGLYGLQDLLLAVAKLSRPIKKSSIISTSFIIQLDYIN